MSRPKSPGFLQGFLFVVEGAGLVLRVPSARKVLLLSILGNLAAMVILVAAGVGAWLTWGASYLESLVHGTLGGFLFFFSGAVVLVVLVAMAFVLFPVLVPVLSGPFHEPLAKRIEAHILGQAPPESSFSFFRGIGHDLSVGLKLLLLDLAVLLLAGLASLFLGAGLLVGLLLGSWLSALSWLDFPLGRRGYSFSRQRAWVRSHFPASMGFGLAVTLSFMIPVYNLFLAGPAAAAGASLLYLRAAAAEEEG